MERHTELNSEIADNLSDAVRAVDAAYDIAIEAWGESDERSRNYQLRMGRSGNSLQKI